MPGLLDGYANYSPEDFLTEAQTFNNPGAQAPVVNEQPQVQMVNEQPQEQIATSILWTDEATNLPTTNIDATPPGFGAGPEGQAISATPPGVVDGSASTGIDAPVEPEVPIDEQIDNATKESVMNVVEGTVDKKVAKAASEIIGDSTGLADVIAKLDAGIEKQESRRDSMKLMMFGLSLLSGDGFSGAANAANAVGNFNSQRIDELYSQRKQIQDRVTKTALDSALPSPVTATKSSASNVYEKPYVFYNEAGEQKIGRAKKDGSGYVDANNQFIDTSSWTFSGEVETNENIRQKSEEALVAYDTKAGEALETTRGLVDAADRTILTVENNIEALGDPLARNTLGRTLARNFGINITGQETDQAVIDLLAQQLNSQSAGIVGLMRAQGVTFGAMSEAEWKKIDAQVGDLQGSLGGIVAAQSSLKGMAHAVQQQADAYGEWRLDPNNRGKSLLQFQRDYHGSDLHKAAKAEAEAIVARGLVKGREVNAKAKGGLDATVDSIEVDDILDKY